MICPVLEYLHFIFEINKSFNFKMFVISARATVMNFFRVPLNLIVVLILTQVSIQFLIVLSLLFECFAVTEFSLTPLQSAKCVEKGEILDLNHLNVDRRHIFVCSHIGRSSGNFYIRLLPALF